ncbi:hypothetical protein BGX27_005471 [Mortierella sp. AM989]|nr:hypothetical protein BGX27_005471 [Mortierella sp. AM989]
MEERDAQLRNVMQEMNEKLRDELRAEMQERDRQLRKELLAEKQERDAQLCKERAELREELRAELREELRAEMQERETQFRKEMLEREFQFRKEMLVRDDRTLGMFEKWTDLMTIKENKELKRKVDSDTTTIMTVTATADNSTADTTPVARDFSQSGSLLPSHPTLPVDTVSEEESCEYISKKSRKLKELVDER